MDDSAQMVAIDKDQLTRMRGEYGPRWLRKSGPAGRRRQLTLLRRWIEHFTTRRVGEPGAMVLATVADETGDPFGTLQKSWTSRCRVLYQLHTSAKGEQLAVTPYIGSFPWYQLGRQAHVQGPVSKVSTEGYSRIGPCAPGARQLGCVGLATIAPGSRFSRPAPSSPKVTRPCFDRTNVPQDKGGFTASPSKRNWGPENRMHNRRSASPMAHGTVALATSSRADLARPRESLDASPSL